MKTKLQLALESLKIVDKTTQLTPFRLNRAQEEFLAIYENCIRNNTPIRLIILKARQLGMSTLIEGLIFLRAFMYTYSKSLVIAHENTSSEHLLSMTNTFWQSAPFNGLYTTRHLATNHIKWNETQSSVRIATANNKAVGRSRTLNSLHASEVAFWDAKQSFSGLSEAVPEVPTSMYCIESTANGIGNYFEIMWRQAVEGENQFIPLFYPWFYDDEYHLDKYEKLGWMDDEEKILRKLGIDDGQLAWRRHKIRNSFEGSVELFHQEYPSSATEAFITTGANVFPPQKLDLCYEPIPGQRGFLVRDDTVRWVPDPTGPITIYRNPSPDLDWGIYYIGADPTRATYGDNAAAAVISRRTLEQVAVWHGKCDPLGFADELAKLGTYYNHAVLAPEIEGPGYATIGRLVEMNYPFLFRNRRINKTPGKTTDTFGWSSSFKNKETMVSWLLRYVLDGDVIIHDKRTYKEMAQYVKFPNGEFGNAAGDSRGYDDTVSALAIAVTCHSLDNAPAPYGRMETVFDRMIKGTDDSWVN